MSDVTPLLNLLEKAFYAGYSRAWDDADRYYGDDTPPTFAEWKDKHYDEIMDLS